MVRLEELTEYVESMLRMLYGAASPVVTRRCFLDAWVKSKSWGNNNKVYI